MASQMMPTMNDSRIPPSSSTKKITGSMPESRYTAPQKEAIIRARSPHISRKTPIGTRRRKSRIMSRSHSNLTPYPQPRDLKGDLTGSKSQRRSDLLCKQLLIKRLP